MVKTSRLYEIFDQTLDLYVARAKTLRGRTSGTWGSCLVGQIVSRPCVVRRDRMMFPRLDSRVEQNRLRGCNTLSKAERVIKKRHVRNVS